MAQRSQPPAPPTAAPEEPPPTLRLDALVAPLLGMTFELRRCYESQARLLTELQHEIDVVRLTSTPFPRRRQGVDNLEHHFRELAKASSDAEELLTSIRATFDSIHEEAHDIEKRQRNL
jgi:hypothetical protein